MVIKIGNFEISRDSYNWIISKAQVVNKEGSKNHGQVVVRAVAYLGSANETIKRVRELLLEDSFETKTTIHEVEYEVLDMLQRLNEMVKGGEFVIVSDTKAKVKTTQETSVKERKPRTKLSTTDKLIREIEKES